MTDRRRTGWGETALAGALALAVAAPAVMAQDQSNASTIAIQPQADKTVTEVEGLTASAAMVPVPQVGEGAPQFSSEELAQIGRLARRENNYSEQAATLQQCFIEAYGVPPPEERIQGYLEAHTASIRLGAFAQAAQYATEEAAAARIAAARGQATQAEVEAKELERQKAVRRVIAAQNELAEGKAKALDAQQLSSDKIPIENWRSILLQKAAERASEEGEAWNPVAREFRDLLLEEVKAVSREDAKGATLVRVTGLIRNPRAKRISIPPLSVSAVDETGYALETKVATARGRIEPGGAVPFAYELNPLPTRARTVVVTFAEPNRTPWLLPASADRVCMPPPPDELDPTRRGGGRRGVALPSGRTFLNKAQ